MKYTLPDLPWAGLLGGIAKAAPSGAVVELYTPEMRALTPHRLAEDPRLFRALRRSRRVVA